jgi:hypothetical protein
MADVIILRLDKPHDRVENLGRRTGAAAAADYVREVGVR